MSHVKVVAVIEKQIIDIKNPMKSLGDLRICSDEKQKVHCLITVIRQTMCTQRSYSPLKFTDLGLT